MAIVPVNRKQMPKMIDDKRMKREDFEFLSSGNTMACKWINNQPVLLLSSVLKEMNDILSVQKRENGPKIATYRLDRKSSVISYLCIFFYLTDIACVNRYLIYNMKHPNKLSLLDYKIVVTKNLIQYHPGWKRTVPMSRPSRRKNQAELIDNHGGHLPDYQTMQKRCAYCAIKGKQNRTFLICLACNIPLCLVRELFPKASHLGVHEIYT